MGEAKLKRAARAAAAEHLKAINPANVAAAIQKVVAALTDYHGADCLLYANLGAGLLRALGVEARAVAGSAAWRIGAGDGDVISHAREIQGPLFKPADAVKAGLFHAWVEGPGLVADFSTCTLALKAAQLDAADGGTTTVEWAPSYLWSTGEPRDPGFVREPRQVRMAPNAGVYTYIRHADIEQVVFENRDEMDAELAPALFSAKSAYEAILEGRELRIFGVGEAGDIQTEARHQGLHPL